MSAKAAVKQSAANPKYNANNICNPIADAGTAIKARLNQFNDAAEGRSADENGQEANAACAGQRKGQRCEGNKVD